MLEQHQVQFLSDRRIYGFESARQEENLAESPSRAVSALRRKEIKFFEATIKNAAETKNKRASLQHGQTDRPRLDV